MKNIRCFLVLACISQFTPNLASASWVVYDDFNDSSFDYYKWRVSYRVNVRGVGISEYEGNLNLLSNTAVHSSGKNSITLDARQLPKEARGYRVKYSVSAHCAFNYQQNPLLEEDHTQLMDFTLRSAQMETISTRYNDYIERLEQPVVPIGFTLLMDSKDEAAGTTYGSDSYYEDNVSGLYSWMAHPVNGLTRSFIATGGSYDPNSGGPGTYSIGSYADTNISKFTNKDISTTLYFSKPDNVRIWSNLFDYTQTYQRNPDLQEIEITTKGSLSLNLTVIPTDNATKPCSIQINEVSYFIP